MKVVQYVMGHANISVTMEVYNHITDRSRIEKEIAKMDLVQIIVMAQISLKMITELLAMDLMNCVHSVAAVAV